MDNSTARRNQRLPTGFGMTRSTRRWPSSAALGGVVGPLAFIGAWAIGSAIAPDYSIVDDAISRLAAVGASTRPLMTGGFVAFGVGLPSYAVALRRRVGGPAWITAATAGLATLAVAALPLDHSPTIDTWHGISAGLGYVALASTPLLARRRLYALGRHRLATLGVACATISAAALVLSATALPTGLFQRIGLTAGDIWIVASALTIASAAQGTPAER